MSAVVLPALDERVRWSLRVIDTSTGAVLADHTSDLVCETASVGKVFLLIEVASRLADGTLRPRSARRDPDEHRVADSGLLYLMRTQRLPVADLACWWERSATTRHERSALSVCGLDRVRAVAPARLRPHDT
ncbi:MAG: serine hydrolase [Microbacterium sp.]